MPLSTATPDKLPDIETLRQITQSIAMLDAIISPEWEYRYYSYNSKWGQNQQMASMRNGCGDDWFLLFDAHGAALKGCAHEYSLAGDAAFSAQIKKIVPSAFSSFLYEPAFNMENASFCLWRGCSDPGWSVVTPANGRITPQEDGSADLMGIFDGIPETYRDFAVDYYEREIALGPVQAIYGHQVLNKDLVSNLNSKRVFSEVMKDAFEIGYPNGT